MDDIIDDGISDSGKMIIILFTMLSSIFLISYSIYLVGSETTAIFGLITIIIVAFVYKIKQQAENRPKPGDSKPYPHCEPTCKFIQKGECKYREMHVPTIAVDFDRVLFTHESWQGHMHVGEPIPGAKEALAKFQKMGFKIMIWTTRAQSDIIADACNNAGIPFDYINKNPNQPPEINPSKPVADYYIDDRAVRFTSWEQVRNEIEERESTDAYYPTEKNGDKP